ncbi:MAG: MBL fold metallo-hydrolase, partial [Spirochaetota bacterium]
MSIRLRYLGFSGFEITSREGCRLVIDPFLEGSEAYSVPPSPISIESLAQTDLVLVSHGAFDHRGQAVEIVKQSNALLACGPEVRIHAIDRGIPEERIVYLLSGCTLDFNGLVIKALDVRHVSFFQSGTQWLSGQPLSFMLKLKGGPTIYHSGDTSLFSDLKLFGELHQPDLALLGVGGLLHHGLEIVPLPPEEAALALEWLGAPMAIPMHYLPDSNAAERFKATVEKRSGARVYIMEPGEAIDLDQKLMKRVKD